MIRNDVTNVIQVNTGMRMKVMPGQRRLMIVVMNTLGAGQIDPANGKPTVTGNLTDQQIADLVAYLQTLK